MNLDAVKDYKVLVIGDFITDEYHYVRVVGKAIKESALSCMVSASRRGESFSGGTWAAAAHVRALCAVVDTGVGYREMVTKRIIEDVYFRKLIVVHEDRGNCTVWEEGHIDGKDFGAYDLVIVCDFGHGTMKKEVIAKVSKEARFLAVNAQTNATNFGFNLITKYPRADLVVIDEMEARLAAHDNTSQIEDVILALGFKKIIVTLGMNGAIGFDGAFERAKALTNKAVDTMGAGDAFLAVTAPFACAGFTMRDLLRIGNAAGAIKIGNIGQKAITKEELKAKLNG